MGRIFFAVLAAVVAYFLVRRFAPHWENNSMQVPWHWIAIGGAAVIAFFLKSK